MGAQPLNYRILRASNLRRVSHPASADALLKGEKYLFSHVRLPVPVGTSQALVNENRNNPQPEGRQAKWEIHCTDYEEPAAKEYFSGCPVSPLIQTDWANKGGLGSPQRLLVTFVRTKVTQGTGAEPPLRKAHSRAAPQPEGLIKRYSEAPSSDTHPAGRTATADPARGKRTRKDPQPCRSKRKFPSASALAAGR